MGLLAAPPPHSCRGCACWHFVLPLPPVWARLAGKEGRVYKCKTSEGEEEGEIHSQTLITPAAPPSLQASSLSPFQPAPHPQPLPSTPRMD